jgi:hypothetical protein
MTDMNWRRLGLAILIIVPAVFWYIVLSVLLYWL